MYHGRSGREPFGSTLWRLPWAILCFAMLWVHSAAAEPKLEYEVKAAFLLNFTKFIEWPASAFESATSPFTICLMGEDPFDNALDQVVAGEAVGGHNLAVQRIRRPPIPSSCQVLFVSKFEKNVRGIFSELAPGILTVGDREEFIREGGMIAFVVEDRRIRFDINVRAAAMGGLSISSRLLNVARSVQR